MNEAADMQNFFICKYPKCRLIFKYKSGLDRHIKDQIVKINLPAKRKAKTKIKRIFKKFKIKKIKLIYCSVCNKMYEKNEFKNHKHNNPFICPFESCYYICYKNKTLKSHIKAYHCNSFYECYLCNKKFRYKAVLSKHIKKIHSSIPSTLS